MALNSTEDGAYTRVIDPVPSPWWHPVQDPVRRVVARRGKSAAKHMGWVRKVYNYMAPYVSKYPREAYVNYRDFDLGMNRRGYTSVSEATTWGSRYFKGNFPRLVRVKSRVDPTNFFWHEQSIPVMWKWN